MSCKKSTYNPCNTNQPTTNNSIQTCCRFYDSLCVLHEDALPNLELPEQSNLKDILNTLDEYLGSIEASTSWGNIGGDINNQTDLISLLSTYIQTGDNISELINDVGYITIDDIPDVDKSLQQVTDVGNETNNSIRVYASDDDQYVELSTGSVGGSPLLNLYAGISGLSTIYNSSIALLVNTPGANPTTPSTKLAILNGDNSDTANFLAGVVHGRLQGQPAINNSEYVVKNQVPDFETSTWTLNFQAGPQDPTPITIDGLTFILSRQRYSVIDGVHFMSFRVRVQISNINPSQFSQTLYITIPEDLPRAPAGQYYIMTGILGNEWEQGPNNTLEDVNRFYSLPYPGNSHMRLWDTNKDPVTVETIFNISDTQDIFFLDFRFIV